ncbi:serine/arginine-rich splicing factor 11-like [Palaemon carinicauda]|uniref:serine/arginine-rich splicing factor 11-like n=1 Tax=Palaemon carinicauda TaxID=392227 RepID=UPI0035B57159
MVDTVSSGSSDVYSSSEEEVRVKHRRRWERSRSERSRSRSRSRYSRKRSRSPSHKYRRSVSPGGAWIYVSSRESKVVRSPDHQSTNWVLRMRDTVLTKVSRKVPDREARAIRSLPLWGESLFPLKELETLMEKVSKKKEANVTRPATSRRPPYKRFTPQTEKQDDETLLIRHSMVKDQVEHFGLKKRRKVRSYPGAKAQKIKEVVSNREQEDQYNCSDNRK